MTENGTDTRVARCSCGAVRIVASGAPGAVVACHCIECQRRTGSVFGVGAYYSPDQLTIQGKTTEFSRPIESGGELLSSFCPRCGTTLFWIVKGEPERVGVAVGAFADPDFPAPIRSVWEQSMHGWVRIDSADQHFPKGRS